MNRILILLASLFLVGESFALPPYPPGVFHNCYGTFTYANGDKYVGEVKDGKKHGQGTYTYVDGGNYVGEYRGDKKHGQGTFTWADGTKYVGEYKDGKRHGQGIYTFDKGKHGGDKYVGEWKDDKRHGEGIYTWADGRKYSGEYRDDLPDGTGRFTYASGSIYTGEFDNGQPNGEGIQTWPNGSKYVGEFKNGYSHGYGKFNWGAGKFNGEEYVGDWGNNQKQGEGVYKYADGRIYDGQWSTDKHDGVGTLTYSTGEKYIGEWKQDKFHGQGTIFYADGRTDSGEWRNGQLVSQKASEETQPKAQIVVNEVDENTQGEPSTQEPLTNNSTVGNGESLYSADNDDEIYILFGRSSSDVRKHLERNYLKDCILKAGEFSVCDTRFFDRSKQSQFFVETRGVGGVTVQRIHGFQGENYLGLKVHISGMSKFLLTAIDQQARRVKTQRLGLQVLLETPKSGEAILWFGYDLKALNDSLFGYDKPAES